MLHRKEPGVGRELLVSVLLVRWALTRFYNGDKLLTEGFEKHFYNDLMSTELLFIDQITTKSGRAARIESQLSIPE